MIKTVNLKHGAKVIFEPLPYVNSVSVGIWVKAGSVNENPSNYGISHFIEHMMFKGTPTRSARKIAEEIDRIGGQMNAFTSKEATCYYVKTISSNICQAAEVLLDMFFHSEFDKEEMEKEKTVVYEEINMHDDSPEDDVSDTFFEVVFNNNPLGTEILGTKENLASFTPDDLRRYISENYTTGNVIISVCGKYDEEALLETFESFFSELSTKEQEKVVYPDTYVPEFSFRERDIEQVHICMGTRAANIMDDLYYATNLVCEILGGSMSSRLFQSVREERGLAYSVYSYLSCHSHDGSFGIYAGVGSDKLEETMEVIKNELSLIRNKGITEDEMLSSKEQLKSSYIFGLENVTARMAANGKSMLLKGKIDTQEEALAKISNVTYDEINEVVARLTDLSSYSAAATGRKFTDLKELINR